MSETVPVEETSEHVVTPASAPVDSAPVDRRAPLGVLGFALAALLVFWPTGIPAVLNAVRSRESAFDGNTEAYVEHRKRALMWSWITIGVAAACIFLYMLFVAVMVAAAIGSAETMNDPYQLEITNHSMI